MSSDEDLAAEAMALAWPSLRAMWDNPDDAAYDERMTIQPLEDRIVVRRELAEEKSPGGIVLPERSREKPLIAEVLAVGPGRYVDGAVREPRLKVGDRVLLSKYSGTEVKVDGQDVLILREEEALAVVS